MVIRKTHVYKQTTYILFTFGLNATFYMCQFISLEKFVQPNLVPRLFSKDPGYEDVFNLLSATKLSA
jgi:hypothetical protein